MKPEAKPPSLPNALVRIVYDPKQKRIRARYEGGGWVRFPKALRQHGTIYQVEELKPDRKGSWIACGSIHPQEKSPIPQLAQGFSTW